jgi:hypothetical protein
VAQERITALERLMQEKDAAAAKSRANALAAREDILRERDAHEEVVRGLMGKIKDLELQLGGAVDGAPWGGKDAGDSLHHVDMLHTHLGKLEEQSSALDEQVCACLHSRVVLISQAPKPAVCF